MRFVISTDGDFVSSHFGRCPSFTIVDVENHEIKQIIVLENPGHHPGLIPQFLLEKGVKFIVCGGIGQRAMQICSQIGIEPIAGITGKIKDVIEEIRKGTLRQGKSLCEPGSGRGYGMEKSECDHNQWEEEK